MLLCVLQVRAEWSVIFIPGGARDFALVRNVQTGCGAHRASCLVGKCDISEEVNQLVPDIDRWPPYCARVNNNWGCNFAPAYALMVCTGTALVVCTGTALVVCTGTALVVCTGTSLVVCTGTALRLASSRCKFSIGVGAATKYLNTASCVENLWIMIAGWSLSLVLKVVGCWDESWEVLNCLSEVNCGIFCCHRLLLNVKWTVAVLAVCWHPSRCGGAQDYSAWLCSRGATVT